MGKIAAYLLTGIVVGVGFAYWQGMGEPAAAIGSDLTIEERGPLEGRLTELETELALERFERQALADQLEELRVSIAELPTEFPVGGRGERMATQRDPDNEDALPDEIRQRFPNGMPQTPEEFAAFQRQREIDAFVAAGFTAERAQLLMRREDELQMEVLQARYEATRNGASEQEVANISTSQLMRKELGDADYARYLEGQGRPTSVGIREILTNSPAQNAGLQPGDEIVAYNGQRVFDMNELNALTYEAQPGVSVPMQVERDGQTIQVYVESGPIGVSSGGGGRARGDFGGRGGGR